MDMADAGQLAAAEVPAGFKPININDGYMESFGQVYYDKARQVMAVRVGPQHLNGLGITHGGMLATLADTAIGLTMMRGRARGEDIPPGVTVTLNLEYLGSGRVGDWLEAHVTLDRMGGRLRFGSCRVMVEDRCLLKASAVFAVIQAPRPA